MKKAVVRIRIPEGITSLTAKEYQELINGKPREIQKREPEPKNDLKLLGIKYNFKAKYYFELTPVPAPRMTRSDQWKTDPNHINPKRRQRKRVANYFEFRDKLIQQAEAKGYSLTEHLNICIILAMPDSWSIKKKERMKYEYHKQTPDRDNLLKAFQDTFPVNDGFVCEGRTLKVWGEEGAIIVF